MSSFNCFVVGLTGGIGSGKSTASQYFEQLGIQIVNADQVARDCVMPGTSALNEIINHFGKKIIDKNGVKIMGETNILNKLPTSASNLYAKNVFNFVSNLYDKENKKININLEDEIIEKTLLK